MKRVLLADRESSTRKGFDELLTRHAAEWEILFVPSSEAALEELGKARFDVIVADMRSPGIDGIALLERVAAEYPQTIRIMLTGHADPQNALRALPVCHQLLSKPCGAGVLASAVERACRLRELVGDDAVRRIVGGISRLPALPSIYAELRRTLADERASASDVARVVRQDVAISAKVLQIVNSAFFGARQRITSIEQAIIYLGVPMIHQIVLAASVFGGIDLSPDCGVNLNEMRDHALLTATIAKDIFSGDRALLAEPWTAGLLHDVGKLVLASSLPDHLPAAMDLARRSGRPLFEAEQELYGVTHAEIGAYLLGTWGLPYSIVEAAANHHRPERVQPTGMDLVIAVHIADALANECEAEERGGDREGIDSPLDTELMATLELMGQLEKWRVSVVQLKSAH